MPRLHTTDLDRFVRFIDDHGADPHHPRVHLEYHPIDLAFDTVVDPSLDPFSPEYFAQQLDLYREISARDLDQASGELHDDDCSRLENAPNPSGIANADSVAETIRCLTTMLALSDVGAAPRVLDLGAGHGLSSEVYVYTGCMVHAIDIDPALGELSRRRAAVRDLDVMRTDMNFDDLTAIPNSMYAAAFFFQSLHHSLRPWALIAEVKQKLSAGGVIAFAGEPIQQSWWRHWGLRLDLESLYVARRRGWFESGWSHGFIRKCFEHSGLTLTFFTGGLHGTEIGIATCDEAKLVAIRARAREIGLSETYQAEGLGITDDLFRTTSGRPALLLGRTAFAQDQSKKGALIHGPYVDLDAGKYQLSFLAQHAPHNRYLSLSSLKLEVSSEDEQGHIASHRYYGAAFYRPRLVQYIFKVQRHTRKVEIRMFPKGARWVASIPIVRKIDAG